MYKRVLLKLSGEALSSDAAVFDSEVLKELALQLKKVVESGVQVVIVVGGGNIMRGKFAKEMSLPRVEADQMGMLGTLINALAIKGACEFVGQKAIVQSSFDCPKICELANHTKAIEALNQDTIVIYGGGTGNPYFSTDTTASLRACETNCEAILMAKNGVDGVYNADPRKDPSAKKYDRLTYREMLELRLGVIDLTAASMNEENGIDAVVFNMNDLSNILKVTSGDPIGTILTVK